MRENGLMRGPELERSRDKRRERLLAGAVIGLASGVLISATEYLPDPSTVDSTPSHEMKDSDKRRLSQQIESLRRLIDQLPAAVDEADEVTVNEVVPDLQTLNITPKLFESFPNKDVLPKRAGSFLIRESDQRSWDMISSNGLEARYQAALDEMVVDLDPNSMHIYIPGNESLDVVISLEKQVLDDGQEYLFLQRTDGGQVGNWRVADVSLDKVRDKLREVVQNEIV